jgi:hypothetical protein
LWEGRKRWRGLVVTEEEEEEENRFVDYYEDFL